MKARIIQSIDMEKVPDKLSELLNSTAENIYRIETLISNCLAVSNISSDSPLKYNLLKHYMVVHMLKLMK